MGALSKQLPRRLIDGWMPYRSSTARYGPAAYWVDSSGCRNTAYVTGLEELVQSLGRCPPAKGLSRPAVEGDRHGRKVLGTVHAEVSALRKVLAQQPVDVLIRAALPGAVGIAEVDLETSVDAQEGVLAHLGPLSPGHRLPQWLGQGGDRAGDGVAHRLGAMPGERRPVLGAHAAAMARHGRQVKQDREPRRALHQGADGGTAQAEDEVLLPVARHRPILRLRRALAEQDLGGEAGLAPSAAARPRHPQRPPGAQAGGQLAAQRPAALHVQRLIDGFVADAHGLIVAEVEPQAAGDLFWAPGCGPPPVLPTPVSAALPGHDGPVRRCTVRGDDETGEPVLHVAPQRLVDRQLGRFWTAGGSVGMPLRGRGPVRQTAAARGGVAAQLARDRGRRALEPAGARAHPVPLRAPDRDLLPLCKRQRAP